jgi:hypothetical protein
MEDMLTEVMDDMEGRRLDDAGAGGMFSVAISMFLAVSFGSSAGLEIRLVLRTERDDIGRLLITEAGRSCSIDGTSVDPGE